MKLYLQMTVFCSDEPTHKALFVADFTGHSPLESVVSVDMYKIFSVVGDE